MYIYESDKIKNGEDPDFRRDKEGKKRGFGRYAGLLLRDGKLKSAFGAGRAGNGNDGAEGFLQSITKSRGAHTGDSMARYGISSTRHNGHIPLHRSLFARQRGLRASFVIEAAYVVPLSLIVLAAMIICGFRMHDILVANLTANEAAELYGHLPEDGGTEEIENYASARLGALLTDTGGTITIEEYKEGSRVTYGYSGGSRVYTDPGFGPETFMRKVTVVEGVLGSD